MKVVKIIGSIYRRFLTRLSPKLNNYIVYKQKFGRRLDLNNPKTLNEKILWLKFNTYYNNPLVKQCADKFRVREYVKEVGCGGILNDLIDVYKSPTEINWEQLPSQFAVKLNIGCGFNYIVSDKYSEDKDYVIHEIKKWIKRARYSWLGYSELQYKDVVPMILIEKYLGGPNGELPNDYKFYCINGKCHMIMYCKDRDSHGHGAKYFYLDCDWNMITNGLLDPNISIDKPVCLDVAIELAERLSKPFPFVRVDLYLLDNIVIFGELTFTPSAGMDVDHKLKPFNNDEDLDHIYGRILQLPSINE